MVFGIVGTFDVNNLGDVMFPMLAKDALMQRLPGAEVRPYSYNVRSAVDWPYPVADLQDLDQDLPHLDGLLIGGGHLVRFEKEIAPDYAPTSRHMAHPCGYWLAPAIAAGFLGVPTVWNAPSASSELVSWGAPLWATAARSARYIAVRDSATKAILAAAEPMVDIRVVPDSVYATPELWSAEQLRERRNGAQVSDRPYLLLQDCNEILELLSVEVEAIESMGYDLVRVPISPVLGDGETTSDLGYSVDPWPDMETIVSLIAGASLVVGRSLHVTILATAYGVPVLRPESAFVAKYAVLRNDPMIGVFAPARLFQALDDGGIGGFDVAAGAEQQTRRMDLLCDHWDRVADEFSEPAVGVPAAGLANILITQTERLSTTQLAGWPNPAQDQCSPPSPPVEEIFEDIDPQRVVLWGMSTYSPHPNWLSATLVLDQHEAIAGKSTESFARVLFEAQNTCPAIPNGWATAVLGMDRTALSDKALVDWIAEATRIAVDGASVRGIIDRTQRDVISSSYPRAEFSRTLTGRVLFRIVVNHEEV